ncbi:MAG TPA: hypothetical protein VKB31_04650 [Trueperaceae bacterium]|nr:hypothetical protein [Trueperaceae bacterium]
MRLRGALNGLRQAPGRLAVGVALLAGVFVGVLTVTRRGVRFLDHYPGIGTIAGAVEQRSLEALFTVLMLAVAFSVLTSAVATLYGSQDLPFLLSLPVDPVRVFTLKVIETYVNSALLPAVFTVPVLVGVGIEKQAPAVFYLIALAALLALYALPVAFGAVAALLLMRVAPAGRAKEVATAASVALAAVLVLGMRALRPERLQHLTPAQFEQALTRFADLHVGWLPSAWGSAAVWGALQGRLSAAALVLAAVSAVALALVARLAAMAYRAGWFRSLDTQGRQGVVGVLPPARWERPIARLGPAGGVVVKDLRLLARDPSQWSQLLVLLALAGVYFISTASVGAEMQRFRDVVGALNLVFLGFLLAGVGIRTAFPLVSLEGEGLWLLRTGPVRARHIVAAKFWGALPPMVLLGGGLGVAVAGRLGVSPTLALATPVAGACAGLAVTGLGVGLGAAFPRFDAASPSEVPLSLGGLIYMALSLAYAVVTTLLFAYPAYRTLRQPGAFHWGSPLGLGLLAAVLLVTALWTLVPLAFGSARLARYESGIG